MLSTTLLIREEEEEDIVGVGNPLRELCSATTFIESIIYPIFYLFCFVEVSVIRGGTGIEGEGEKVVVYEETKENKYEARLCSRKVCPLVQLLYPSSKGQFSPREFRWIEGKKKKLETRKLRKPKKLFKNAFMIG